MARGRTVSSAGQLFGEFQIGHGFSAPVGQPVMIRMQGIPTMPGYRDRPGKWNMIDPRKVREWLRRVIQRWRPASSGV